MLSFSIKMPYLPFNIIIKILKVARVSYLPFKKNYIIIYFHMFVDINFIFNLETSSINVNRRKPIRVFLPLFK